MSKIKMFLTVGTTPEAVANALAAHIQTFEQDAEIHCYFFVGSDTPENFPHRTSSDITSVVEAFNQNKRSLDNLKSYKVILHTEELIDIYEYDLLENVGLTVSAVDQLIEDGDRVIFDITGGRKIMTGSALLSIMIMRQKRPQCTYEVAYYWLKRFTPENLNKMLYELGFDAYESIFTPLEQLDEKVRTVRQ